MSKAPVTVHNDCESSSSVPSLPDQALDVGRAASQRRERNWTMLFVAAIVVALTFALQVREDQRVELRLLPGFPAPESCLSRLWFEQDCPGCGLTRSFIHLGNGNWRESLSTHRIGWYFALAILAQLPYRWISLRSPTQTESPVWARWFGWSLIVSLICNWLFNVLIKAP